MKNIISYALASAALASAQVTYNETDGTFTCAVPNKAYCAGSSLGTDIIIRCNGTKGQPGRCTDNLAGQPPLGVNPALCYQSSPTAGDAACEKNCVVYAPSSTFTLPASVCTPYYTPSSTSSTKTSTTKTSTDSHSSKPTSTHTTKTHTTKTYTTTDCETTPTTTTDCESTPSHKPTYPPHGHNTTLTTVYPTTTLPTPPPVATAGAAANKAAGALAVVGLFAAYLL